jgi:predicted MFS family arabinose efflux permease
VKGIVVRPLQRTREMIHDPMRRSSVACTISAFLNVQAATLLTTITSAIASDMRVSTAVVLGTFARAYAATAVVLLLWLLLRGGAWPSRRSLVVFMVLAFAGDLIAAVARDPGQLAIGIAASSGTVAIVGGMTVRVARMFAGQEARFGTNRERMTRIVAVVAALLVGGLASAVPFGWRLALGLVQGGGALLLVVFFLRWPECPDAEPPARLRLRDVVRVSRRPRFRRRAIAAWAAWFALGAMYSATQPVIAIRLGRAAPVVFTLLVLAGWLVNTRWIDEIGRVADESNRLGAAIRVSARWIIPASLAAYTIWAANPSWPVLLALVLVASVAVERAGAGLPGLFNATVARAGENVAIAALMYHLGRVIVDAASREIAASGLGVAAVSMFIAAGVCWWASLPPPRRGANPELQCGAASGSGTVRVAMAVLKPPTGNQVLVAIQVPGAAPVARWLPEESSVTCAGTEREGSVRLAATVQWPVLPGGTRFRRPLLTAVRAPWTRLHRLPDPSGEPRMNVRQPRWDQWTRAHCSWRTSDGQEMVADTLLLSGGDLDGSLGVWYGVPVPGHDSAEVEMLSGPLDWAAHGGATHGRVRLAVTVQAARSKRAALDALADGLALRPCRQRVIDELRLILHHVRLPGPRIKPWRTEERACVVTFDPDTLTVSITAATEGTDARVEVTASMTGTSSADALETLIDALLAGPALDREDLLAQIQSHDPSRDPRPVQVEYRPDGTAQIVLGRGAASLPIAAVRSVGKQPAPAVGVTVPVATVTWPVASVVVPVAPAGALSGLAGLPSRSGVEDRAWRCVAMLGGSVSGPGLLAGPFADLRRLFDRLPVSAAAEVLGRLGCSMPLPVDVDQAVLAIGLTLLARVDRPRQEGCDLVVATDDGAFRVGRGGELTGPEGAWAGDESMLVFTAPWIAGPVGEVAQAASRSAVTPIAVMRLLADTEPRSLQPAAVGVGIAGVLALLERGTLEQAERLANMDPQVRRECTTAQLAVVVLLDGFVLAAAGAWLAVAVGLHGRSRTVLITPQGAIPNAAMAQRLGEQLIEG